MTTPRPPRPRRALAPALLLAALAADARAQSEALRFHGDLAFDSFGWSVDGGSDLDGDGRPELLVGGYGGADQHGRIKVFSGATGALLHRVVGAPGEGIGFEVAFVHDVDGDGVLDFAATGHGSQARVYSGLDAHVLLTLPTYDLAGISSFPDQNADGLADLRVGPYVFSASDASPLRTLIHEGFRLVMAGDVDADGVADYIDQGDWPFFARVRSGVDDSLLMDIRGEQQGFANGVGDANGDGHADVLATWTSTLYGGVAELRSGLDGSLLRRYEGLDFAYLGSLGQQRLAGVGDVDGDGRADFVVATVPPTLYSGATGCPLARFVRSDGSPQAFSVAGAGDVDGDGRGDVIAGDPGALGPANEGTSVVFTYDGPVGTPYCIALPNSTGVSATITALGSLSGAANDLVLIGGGMPPGRTALFFYGGGQVLVPFGNGVRCVADGGQGLFRLPAASADLAGCLELALDNASPLFAGGPLAPGAQWNFQLWYRDPAAGGAGFNLSNALSLSFVP